MKTRVLAIAGLFVLLLLPTFFLTPSPSFRELPQDSIPLKEALGQTLLIGFEGKEMTHVLEALIKELQPGGVLLLERNIEGKEQLKALVSDLQRVSAIPLFVAVDQEGGIVSRVPWVESTSQAALQDPEQAFRIGERRGWELQELGINMNLAPVLDSTGPQDFLFERTFQKDEVESAEYARSLILGHRESGVLSVPKHYPGYGGIVGNPELQTIPRRPQFPDSSAFEHLFSQISTPFFMLSHVIYEDVDEEYPLPLSVVGMNKVRSRIGDEKIIVSDDLLSEALLNVYEPGELARRAVYSGVDILLVAGYPDASNVEEFYDELLLAAKEDDVLTGRIRVAAAKILELKQTIFITEPQNVL